jgi:hypothetical protein
VEATSPRRLRSMSPAVRTSDWTCAICLLQVKAAFNGEMAPSFRALFLKSGIFFAGLLPNCKVRQTKIRFWRLLQHLGIC